MFEKIRNIISEQLEIEEEKIMDIQFKNFSLTNQRFKSLNQSILGMYYTIEGIHSIVDEKMIHEDFSLENIQLITKV